MKNVQVDITYTPYMPFTKGVSIIVYRRNRTAKTYHYTAKRAEKIILLHRYNQDSNWIIPREYFCYRSTPRNWGITSLFAF